MVGLYISNVDKIKRLLPISSDQGLMEGLVLGSSLGVHRFSSANLCI